MGSMTSTAAYAPRVSRSIRLQDVVAVAKPPSAERRMQTLRALFSAWNAKGQKMNWDESSALYLVGKACGFSDESRVDIMRRVLAGTRILTRAEAENLNARFPNVDISSFLDEI